MLKLQIFQLFFKICFVKLNMSALNISERDSIFKSAATAARGNKWDSQSQRGEPRGHKWSRDITGIGLICQRFVDPWIRLFGS